MELGHTGPGTSWNWATLGLVHHGTGPHWAWYIIELGHTGPGTSWNWATLGLVHHGNGTQVSYSCCSALVIGYLPSNLKLGSLEVAHPSFLNIFNWLTMNFVINTLSVCIVVFVRFKAVIKWRGSVGGTQ